MLNVKILGSIGLVGALLATAACGDSSKSMNPTAPSAVAATTLSAEAGDAGAEWGTAAKGSPGKPENPGNGNGNGNGKGGPPANTTPDAPSVPPNPGTTKIEIEGLITAIAGTTITVNGQVLAVPADAVIRHGSRAVAYSELAIGDRVHVKARMQGTVLEATEVKLQNPGGEGDDEGDGDNETGGKVWVSLFDAAAAETGTDTGIFRLTRSPSATLPLTSPLTVTFSLAGTATNGTDYTNVPLTATFLAGSATAEITVSPIADALAEGPETVVLTLVATAPYTPGSPTSGTVTITDAAPVVSVTALNAAAAETGPNTGTLRQLRRP